MNRHPVLVVEDDAEIRDALVDILGDHGCDVVGVSNGAHALKYLETAAKLPCIIILDLMMPVMDGEAFREAQLADPRLAHIPVIVVSADRDVQGNASKLRAVSFVKKPPKVDVLLSMVDQHC
jgi:two-component system, chemotaxis family, chemotaxis protein CheY